jgi:hypothetical protein
MIFIGMCVGAPVLNFISEKLKDCIKTVVLSGIIMFTIFVLLITKVMNIGTITAGFFVVGICCAYQILAIYKASTYVDQSSANLATAIANMIIMIFGYVIHGDIGLIVNMCGNADPAAAFCYGIAVIPAALFIGIIGFIVVFQMDKNATSQKVTM